MLKEGAGRAGVGEEFPKAHGGGGVSPSKRHLGPESARPTSEALDVLSFTQAEDGRLIMTSKGVTLSGICRATGLSDFELHTMQSYALQLICVLRSPVRQTQEELQVLFTQAETPLPRSRWIGSVMNTTCLFTFLAPLLPPPSTTAR